MKVVIAQTNPTPGSFSGNVLQLQAAIIEAGVSKASLVVAPEMAIPGYLCRDSMLTEGFIEMNLSGLSFVMDESKKAPGVTIVVGYVEKNTTGIGKPLFNSAAVIRDGVIIANYRKHLLPFYDVFDEGRYFEPGKDLTVVEIDGKKFGVLICEDGWNDKDVDDYRYEDNPVERYRKLGIRNLIWLNASPYVIGKPVRRQKMVCKITDGGGLAIYANQIGGQDDLVFDGNSFVAINGSVHYACKEKEDCHLIDLNENYGFQSHGWDGPQEIRRNLVLGLRDYVLKSGFHDVVVASSGGIDSALVLCLACQAIGPEHVHAIRMPGQYSSKWSVDDALELHKNLGCHDYLMPIDNESLQTKINRDLLGNTEDGKKFGNKFQKYNTIADENLQARMRAINLMHFSNAFGILPLTTGNKSENATGYCTLGGDMMGGFAPIQDLYKCQVYEVAELYASNSMRIASLFEAIPKSILDKAPSAELAPNQTDEGSLLPYGILDLIIMAYVEHGVSKFETFAAMAESKFKDVLRYKWENHHKAFVSSEDAGHQYARIIRLIDVNEFKRRQAAPGIKVSKVAFGTGRRFPIVRGRW